MPNKTTKFRLLALISFTAPLFGPPPPIHPSFLPSDFNAKINKCVHIGELHIQSIQIGVKYELWHPFGPVFRGRVQSCAIFFRKLNFKWVVTYRNRNTANLVHRQLYARCFSRVFSGFCVELITYKKCMAMKPACKQSSRSENILERIAKQADKKLATAYKEFTIVCGLYSNLQVVPEI